MGQLMRRAARICGIPALGGLLAVLLALTVLPARAEEPVAEPPARPLFGLDEEKPARQVSPAVLLAVLTEGGASASGSGAWNGLTAYLTGTHPEINTWTVLGSLRGPMASRASRGQIGAATLFLAGCRPAVGGIDTTPFTTLATARAGDEVKCWDLIDTDVVRPWPKPIFEWIHDGKGLFVGTLETEAFAEVVKLAFYTSSAAFQKKARHDLSYANLFLEPEEHRSEVVHIEGRLKRLDKYEAPLAARGAGVNDYYEAWIFNDAYGANPFVAIVTALPPGLKPAAKIAETQVAFDGYFYKKFRYKAGDTTKPNQFRDAPALIGHTLVLVSKAPEAETTSGDNWGHDIMWVFIGVLGSAVVVVAGLTYWFRHSDKRIRRRLAAVRESGFVAPPPDET